MKYQRFKKFQEVSRSIYGAGGSFLKLINSLFFVFWVCFRNCF
nr:MAG TPA: hypothetical protein [Caudoviricetes sp.]